MNNPSKEELELADEIENTLFVIDDYGEYIRQLFDAWNCGDITMVEFLSKREKFLTELDTSFLHSEQLKLKKDVFLSSLNE